MRSVFARNSFISTSEGGLCGRRSPSFLSNRTPAGHGIDVVDAINYGLSDGCSSDMSIAAVCFRPFRGSSVAFASSFCGLDARFSRFGFFVIVGFRNSFLAPTPYSLSEVTVNSVACVAASPKGRSCSSSR